jgi:phage terminase small subunit
LALLNNAFIWKPARSLVEKAGDNITEEGFISHVWLQTLARQPRADERTAASAHLLAGRRLLGLEKEARTSLALVLMNTNEFMFID